MHSLKVLHERMEVETIGYCKVSKEESVRCFAERFWAESVVLRMSRDICDGHWGCYAYLFEHFG